MLGSAFAESRTLKAGDFAWTGESRDRAVWIGAELKTVGDAICCMRSGRFASVQAPEMLRLYDYRYLIVQGVWRCTSDGRVEVFQGSWHSSIPPAYYNGLRHWLTTVRLAGFHVVELAWEDDVRDWLLAEFTWWQKSEHTSLRETDWAGPGLVGVESAEVRNSWARRMLRAVPMLGWTRSLAAAKHFGSIKRAVNASAKEWQEVDGIGRTLAARIVAGFESELTETQEWRSIKSRRVVCGFTGHAPQCG